MQKRTRIFRLSLSNMQSGEQVANGVAMATLVIKSMTGYSKCNSCTSIAKYIITLTGDDMHDAYIGFACGEHAAIILNAALNPTENVNK